MDDLSTTRLDSIQSRLEKIESDGFSGIHPVIESNLSAVKKIESELMNSASDAMQMSTVLGRNACFIVFDDDGKVDLNYSTASNVTASLILESIDYENSLKFLKQKIINYGDVKLHTMLTNVACAMARKRKYYHQTVGDESIAGKGELIGFDRASTSEIMQFFARVNNSGEDIGKICRDCVRKFQIKEKKELVADCEVN